jgi:phosphoribosylamine--glycine ligase
MSDKDILELNLGLVIVGPEKPLSDGIADEFIKLGIPVFGPTKLASQLEASKIYSKEIMNELKIPTAKWRAISKDDFLKISKHIRIPCVIKADGLASGKGVFICDQELDIENVVSAIKEDKFGSAMNSIIIEEKLEGKEASIMAICDGTNSIMLPSSRDYKKRYDKDKGPNTGGMGAISPIPNIDNAFLKTIQNSIITPILKMMKSSGHEFRGILYVGLILTNTGPKVLEFNVRFGDPECQVLMLMIKDDLLPILINASNGALLKKEVAIKDGAACCVVVCNKDYPNSKSNGEEVHINLEQLKKNGIKIFFSGIEQDMEKYLTSGGRIMSVCSYGENIFIAKTNIYNNINLINFKEMCYRTDIGFK